MKSHQTRPIPVTPPKLLCTSCGAELELTIDRHYIARDLSEKGLASAFSSKEAKLYDAFDCPKCGCQTILGERKRSTADDIAEAKDVDFDAAVDAEIERRKKEEAEKAEAELKESEFQRLYKFSNSHCHRVSEQYSRGLFDAAYVYCKQEGLPLHKLVDKWMQFVDTPGYDFDEAYAMARLRTRRAIPKKKEAAK